MYIYLIDPLNKSIINSHPGGYKLQKDIRLTCITMLYPAAGWFKIYKVTFLDLDKFMAGNE